MGTLSARLQRFDMTTPIVFTAPGVLLTQGALGITPGTQLVKMLAEAATPRWPGATARLTPPPGTASPAGLVEVPKRHIIRRAPASQSPMVLLRARTLLTTLLNAAPPARQHPITRRLRRAEELGTSNFPRVTRGSGAPSSGIIKTCSRAMRRYPAPG